jgi:hypothetical protein
MSKAFAESCRLHSASLLMIFGTRTVPVDTPDGENPAIATSPGGPLCGSAADGGAGRSDHAAIPAATMLPLRRKARLVTFCWEASSTRPDSNTASPRYIGLTPRRGVTANYPAAWSPIHSAAPGWPALWTRASPVPRKRQPPSSCLRDIVRAAWDWPPSFPESAYPTPRGR